MDTVTKKHDFSKLPQCHLNPAYQEWFVNSFNIFPEILLFGMLLY